MNPKNLFIKNSFLSISMRLNLALVLVSLLISPAVEAGAIPVAPTAITRSVVVSPIADDNPGGGCTLREAIDLANVGAGSGTFLNGCTVTESDSGTPIAYVLELPAYTYTLTGEAGEDSNISGDLDILVSVGDLIIQGNGVESTIIDGGGLDRVLHICPGGGCDNNVAITGVTIQNGFVSGSGGGISSEAGTVTVDSSAVITNTASLNGGGIWNQALLVIIDSTIGGIGFGNHAHDGGGIYTDDGTVVMDNSAVNDNTATDDGGGIFVYQGSLTVQNGSTIGEFDAGNRATDEGGGIHNHAGAIMLDASNVISNTATDFGGGIYNYAGTVTLETSSVISNTATGGGGVFVDQGTLAVQNSSTISRNTVSGGGGGVYTLDAITMLDSSTISNNTAIGRGGGIYNQDSTITLDASAIISNTAGLYGGGVGNWGTLNIQNNSVIVFNTAGSGGGIYAQGAVTIVEASMVISNTADSLGGGVCVYGQILNANNDISNMAIQDGSDYSPGTTILNAAIIDGNQAEYGGGIWNGDTMTITNSTISDNTTLENGGGIYNVSWGSIAVTDSRILNNAATEGGGVYTDDPVVGETNVTGSCIVGNSSMSFFNNQPAQQIATSNWWGAATGPNTSGADTYGGNVDVSGFLTAPILDCAPDLQVTKTNDTGGHGTLGTPFHWALAISNTGLVTATFTFGQIILVDDLPSGPIYGAPVAADFVGVSNGADITCAIVASTLTCQVSGAGVSIAPGGRLAVTFSVTPNALVTLVNPVGICQVDPDGHITEGDESNNDCNSDIVNITEQPLLYQYLPLLQK